MFCSDENEKKEWDMLNPKYQKRMKRYLDLYKQRKDLSEHSPLSAFFEIDEEMLAIDKLMIDREVTMLCIPIEEYKLRGIK